MENTKATNQLVIKNFSEKDFNFIHPMRLLVAGPSSSGKTTWVHSLIKNSEHLISPQIDKIYYVYDIWQPCFEKIKNQVTFTQDMDILDMENEKKLNILICLDDLQEELLTHIKSLKNMMTKRSHHLNISVIIILQNAFANSSFTTTICNNLSNYYLTKHYCSLDQINVLSRHLGGQNGSKEFMEAYRMATSEQFQGLFIDIHPCSKTKDIFPFRYYNNGNIMEPIFLINSKNTHAL